MIVHVVFIAVNISGIIEQVLSFLFNAYFSFIVSLNAVNKEFVSLYFCYILCSKLFATGSSILVNQLLLLSSLAFCTEKREFDMYSLACC